MWAGEGEAKNAEVAPDIKEARELAFKSSPVASIANWRSPVLLIHGDDDRNVPFQQTTDLVEKSRVRGANHPRRNSRPAPLERLGPGLPRHCRIL
ncbi:MAG: hypothetical protein DME99_11125 [Verrucomicrobia bacterium]|nr:MAG: hypothetical protein DME99_11125 [Verrucomicrobiota bacterium]